MWDKIHQTCNSKKNIDFELFSHWSVTDFINITALSLKELPYLEFLDIPSGHCYSPVNGRWPWGWTILNSKLVQ